MKARIAACLALGWLALAAQAHAQPRPALGSQGQWLLAGSVGVTYEKSHWRGRELEGATISALDEWHMAAFLAPSALYFVTTDLALGAAITLGVDHRDYLGGPFDPAFDVDEFHFGGAGVLAYHAALGADAFVLPQLSLGAVRSLRSLHWDELNTFVPLRHLYDPLGADLTVLQAQLFAPLGFVPGPNFFLSFGPYVRVECAPGGTLAPNAQDWALSFGLASLIGTWL